LVRRLDEFEGQGQRSRSPGTKTGIFRPLWWPACSLCLVKHLQPLVTFPARAVAKYCDGYVCLSVCVSVCLRGYLQNHACSSLPNFLCMLPVSVHYSVLLQHVYDRLHRLSPGRVFFRIKTLYRPGKGDGSAQRGRSVLSTIALLLLCCAVLK